MLVPAGLLQPAHMPFDIGSAGGGEIESLSSAPAEIDAEIRLGV
jgi:hypothetical protein